ncbi:SDR family NAD(P)-dependent oxidoreductase [Rhodovibrio salinarum]|uniref:SDR family oxidoreductase n=1 Tax=Rhodovibrio salinarum TaxID=1087 RepID=A0A934UZV4_9PROT|nr:SDR family NAD(P)-dependent oxidoreductase [Rhodovibrio salinarum]MBK1697572.1 SDR family oxidoreductase [Rhodovibrio salinarum]
MVAPHPSQGIAWITGASSGIGRGLAMQLASEGWQVCASARRQGELDKMAEEARDMAGAVVPVPLDVTDAKAVREAVEDIEREYGAIALTVLTAGTHQPISARAFDAGAVQKLLNLNVMGQAYPLEALLPRLIDRGAGRIAVVASVAGYRGLPTAAGYGASKAGVINMCESLRPELAGTGVTLQLVNPGFVRTPLTDQNDFNMPMLMELEDAVASFRRQLDSDKFEIVFPWRFAMIMKLLRILPYAVLFKLTARMVPKHQGAE